MQARLIGVLLDQIVETPEIALDLTLPVDPRARQVADRVRAQLGGSAALDLLARNSGASTRTLAQDTGALLFRVLRRKDMMSESNRGVR